MKPANMGLQKYVGGTYNHARSVHHLVIHIYNAKQPLLWQAYISEVPLDGQMLPESGQKIEI